MTDIKLLAIDLDDTLLTDSKEMEPKAKYLLRRASSEGIHVVISTGRGYASASYYSSMIAEGLPLISGNGARLTHGRNGEKLLHSTIAGNISSEIASYFDMNKWDLIVSTGEKLIRTNYTPLTTEDYGFTFVDSGLVATSNFPECIISGDEKGVDYLIDICENRFSEKVYVEIFHNNDGSIFSVSVLDRKATKGYALKYLAQKLNLTKENIMAIGDNINDVSMLKEAGVSVVMGNAPDDIKQFADFVAPANNDAGVAFVIEKFLFNNKMD